MSNIFALLVVVSFILLIVGFFNANASLFWLKKNRTRTKSALIYGISCIVFFSLFSSTLDINTDYDQITTRSGSNYTQEYKNQNEAPKARWIEVYTFKGNGLKKSSTFELSGGEAKIKYKFKSFLGLGMFAVYVVNDGTDIMTVGGIPELMTSAEQEESESSIQKRAGRYYLNVNGAGDWIVTIEEFK